ncbi:MAG: rhamnulokinase [Bacteroidales bacterium]|nr:rhamnulokinase [Bacteroidales bacterium]
MKKQCFAAVDLGATSGRLMLAHVSESGVEMEEVCRFPNHLIQVGEHLHWDIYELYRQVVEGLKTIASQGVQLTSIGIDTWGCDFALLGKDGGLLRLPYAYRDPHTLHAAEAYFREFSREKTYAETGIQVMDFNSLFQFYTLRKNGDAAFAQAEKILFMPDALAYLLTGETVCEYTVATTAQIVDARRKCLSPEVLRSVGLTEDSFGRWVCPGTVVGPLTPALQKQTGLGAVPVVAVGGHDTASAVAAVPAKSSRFAYLSSGTWSLMGIETGRPLINADTERLNFTNEGGVCGSIRVLKNICGMWLLERCREKWPDIPYPDLIREAEGATAFRCLIFPDAPEFAMPDDMEAVIRAYCRKTAQAEPDSRAALVRCIFESLAMRYRQVLERLDSLSGEKAEALHIIGGGSRNDLLNQWTADSIGRPVVAGPSEATALGNVLLQCMAADPGLKLSALRSLLAESLPLKSFHPQTSQAAHWNTAYRRFEDLSSAERN